MIVRILLTLLSALFFYLSFPDKPAPLLALACLAPLGIALRGADTKSGILLGFLYGFFVWLAMCWWFSNALYFHEAFSRSMAWFWTLTGCAVFAAPYAVFGWLCCHFNWMDRTDGPLRCALCLTVFMAWYPFDFPAHHAHALYGFPAAIQILDLGGVPLLLFVLNLFNFLLAGAVIDRLDGKIPLGRTACLAFLALLTVGYGFYRLEGLHRKMKAAGTGRFIRMVSIQPNVTIKRVNELIFFGKDKKINNPVTAYNLSVEAVRRYPDARLIVWPEMPSSSMDDPESGICPLLRTLAVKTGIPFLVNADMYDPVLDGRFNNAQLIQANGDFGPRHSKRILFPFGEYLPLEKKFPVMRKLFPNTAHYIPGRDTNPLPLGGINRMISMLCYEVVFSENVREFVENGGDVIVNMVNDAYFGKSDASAIHMALGLYRTVEYRAPMVRATNSGNSAFIRATGEIVPGSRTPVFEEAVTSFPLYVPEKRSVYFVIGDLFLWALTVVFVLDMVLQVAAIWFGRKKFLWVRAAATTLCLVFFLVCQPAFCIGGEPSLKARVTNTEMTLAECVMLAVRHNRSIESAYLDRVVQKFDLKVAEDEFMPDLTISPEVQRSTSGEGDSRSDTVSRGVTATVTEKIPTGGQFSFAWANTAVRTSVAGQMSDDYRSSWQVSFQQPLLKGAGVDVNTVSLETARINEQINVLNLKSTISETITAAILAYRSFVQASKQMEITRSSVERAKELLKVNRALIEAGRMANVEIVQTEADLANKEFDLTQAENALDAARLALLKTLDIDKHTKIVPTETIFAEPILPDLQTCQALALKNRRDFQQALLNLKISEMNLIVAEDNRLWDLSLEAGYGITGSDTDHFSDALEKSQNSARSQWNVGLKLSIPFGDLTREQQALSASTALKKLKINLTELQENIEIEVLDAVRDVEMKLKQAELARQARGLSERKLEIEKEKLRAGRSSNFQLVTFQNDLVSAQNNALNAGIAYLNALTVLDKTLEATLETWKIEVKEN